MCYLQSILPDASSINFDETYAQISLHMPGVVQNHYKELILLEFLCNLFRITSSAAITILHMLMDQNITFTFENLDHDDDESNL